MTDIQGAWGAQMDRANDPAKRRNSAWRYDEMSIEWLVDPPPEGNEATRPMSASFDLSDPT
jgi:hypothetical protein